MMCCKVYIGQTTDVEENLDPKIFDVIDSIVIFWELEHAWKGHAPQLNVNVLNVDSIKNYLRVASRIT